MIMEVPDKSGSSCPTRESNRRLLLRDLCPRSSKIDFEDVIANSTQIGAGHIDIDSEQYAVEEEIQSFKTLQPGCPLCQMFLNLTMAQLYGAEKRTELPEFFILLRSTNRDRPWNGLEPIPIFTILVRATKGPDPCIGFIAIQHAKAPKLRAVYPQVNVDLLKGWMQLCKDEHEYSCFGPNEKFLGSSTYPLRLIDCETRELVEVKDMAYATLSYVWGVQESLDPVATRENTLSKLPKSSLETIGDAIIITRKLGIRYLWIDRYCINQRDSQEVAMQTSVMHRIYNDSVFTIIAACGSDPGYGLPGVGKRLRMASRITSLILGDFSFQAVPWDIKKQIASSKWATRGWTYQEQLCSKRRFYFTDTEVYYECDGTFRLECGIWDPMLPPSGHLCPMDRMHSFFNQLQVRPSKDLRRWPQDLVKHLRQYSKRTLTRQEDTLRAILGVLSAYEFSEKHYRPPLAFHKGVPLLPTWYDLVPLVPNGVPEGETAWDYNAQFFCALGWDFTVHDWHTPKQRRLGFPSWSWAGWHDSVGGFPWERETGRFSFTPGSRFEVETLTGDVLTFEDVQKLSQAARQTQLSNFVHLSALTTPVSISILSSDENFIEIVADAEENCEAHFPLIPDTLERLCNKGLMLHLIELEGGRHTSLIVA